MPLVITSQRGSQARCLYPHNRIDRWIEGCRAAKYVHGDGVGFYRLASTSKQLLRDEAEKLLVALRGMEFGVSEHPLQLSACFVFGNRRVQREGLDTIAMQGNSPKCLRLVFPAHIFYIDRSHASKPKATNS